MESVKLDLRDEAVNFNWILATLSSLKGLKRLVINGTPSSLNGGVRVSQPLSATLPVFTRLDELIFRNIDFVGQNDTTHWLPPNLKSLGLVHCFNEYEIYVDPADPAQRLVAINVREFQTSNQPEYSPTGSITLSCAVQTCEVVSVWWTPSPEPHNLDNIDNLLRAMVRADWLICTCQLLIYE